jgi:hypothetical protein
MLRLSQTISYRVLAAALVSKMRENVQILLSRLITGFDVTTGKVGCVVGDTRASGRGRQQGFLFAGEFALGPGARLRLQVTEDKAAVDGRAADPNAGRNLLVAGSGVGRQQNLRALDLADRVFSYTRLHRRTPAEADMQQYFDVSPRRSIPCESRLASIFQP